MARKWITDKLFWSTSDGDSHPKKSQKVYRQTGVGSSERVKGVKFDPSTHRIERKKKSWW